MWGRFVDVTAFKRWGWQLLLALLMLLTQQGALRHALTHAVGDAEDDRPASVHNQLCKQCLAYAIGGDAVTSHVTLWSPPVVVYDTPMLMLTAQCAVGVEAGYCPRAPPSV
jgi:hypothetical protein